MRLADLVATLRLSASAAFHSGLGRMRGISHVPHPRTMLFIEPVSHCNLNCSFCTYRLQLRPQTVMDLATFADYADQALEMGFGAIVLTPINGDIFMDKGVLAKLRHLEHHRRDHAVMVYTNLIGATPELLAEILSMRRLSMFQVSIYGHDLDTFERITGRGESQFSRLLTNLAALEAQIVARGEVPAGLTVCVRTRRGYDPDRDSGGELSAILCRLRRLGVEFAVHSTLDDWGGLIGEADLAGLDMRLIRGRWLHKNGACVMPFFSLQVMADGRVNACACRAIRGDLVIGDLTRQRLAHVLSADNPAYLSLIEAQQAGNFPESCRGCSFYRSIFDKRAAGTSPLGEMSLAQFRHFLDGGK